MNTTVKYGKFLVAHRGYSAAYPENTLLAVESALALGACFIEVDVHLSADHVPVVIHDADLRRTAGKEVNAMDYSFSQLQNFSVHEPERFGHKYLPQRIPSLQAVVESIRRHPKCTLFIEAKRASIAWVGVEAFLNAVEPVIATAKDQCVLISFDSQVLAAAKCRQLSPVGWVFEKWSEDSYRTFDRLQPDYLFTDYTKVPEGLANLPQGPWRWALYTIDEATLALTWFEKGADLVETNNFGALIGHTAFTGRCNE